MDSEFNSVRASELPQDELAEPGPTLNSLPGPIPSFQDLTDSSGGEQDDEQDWEAIVRAAEAAFTEEEIAKMTEYLKERGLFAFVTEYVERRAIPIRTLLLAFGLMIPIETPFADQLRMLKIACSRVLRNRERLEEYQTIDDAVSLIRKSKKILILSGAGVSTSCGIPDFRSSTGLYARLKAEGTWELDDPQDMFDMRFFRERPDVFYSFAKEIYPSNFIPSPCHRFVRLLELNDKLLRNYTQNIDGLFEQVGCERMLNCHGSFATASCLECRRRYPGSHIESDVFASRVPLCPVCTAEAESLRLSIEEEKARKPAEKGSPPKKKRKVEEWEEDNGDGDGDDEASGEGLYGYGNLWRDKAIIKPDIVFFGENLSDEFDRKLLADRDEVDLLIVMGTSLRVSPVAQLPSHLPHSIPQILINRDPVSHHNFDICLLGDGDTVVKYLCERLQEAHLGDVEENTLEEDMVEKRQEWDLEKKVPVQRSKQQEPAASRESQPTHEEHLGNSVKEEEEEEGQDQPVTPERVSTSHVWLFPGANKEARWVEMVRQAFDEEENGGERAGDSDESTDSGDQNENGPIGNGERQSEGTIEGQLELAADLAPGVVAGEGSDGEASGEDDDQSEDGTQERLGGP